MSDLPREAIVYDEDGEPAALLGAGYPVISETERLDALRSTVEARTLPPVEKRVELRRDAGLSQTELAAHLGVTPQAVSLWETGERTPRGELRERYSAALKALTDE